MKISVLGTGRMATAMATGAQAAGHAVIFGSRAPDTRTGLSAPVTGFTEAVRDADLVINAIDGAAALTALTTLQAALDGRILLDVTNAISPDGELVYPNDSLAANLQRALPGTRIVKSLNTVSGTVAAEPALLGASSTVFLSGDDTAAKALVRGLLRDLGWSDSDQLDLGGIQTARAPEHAFFLTFALLQHARFAPVNLAVVEARRREP